MIYSLYMDNHSLVSLSQGNPKSIIYRNNMFKS